MADVRGNRGPGVNAVEDESWRERGACHPLLLAKVVTVDDFFPEGQFVKNSPEYKAHIARIKAICATCPVTNQCVEFADLTHQKEGMWGGLTRSQRTAKRYPRQRVDGKLTYIKGIAS